MVQKLSSLVERKPLADKKSTFFLFLTRHNSYSKLEKAAQEMSAATGGEVL